jgi:hypothetical protein
MEFICPIFKDRIMLRRLLENTQLIIAIIRRVFSGSTITSLRLEVLSDNRYYITSFFFLFFFFYLDFRLLATNVE